MQCEVCGNDYDKAFQVTMKGKTRTFDCFECRVVGHGVENAGKIYCCANCARAEGVSGLRDHA
jgi:hypothetical protein